jgi:hypothetical protein
MQTRHRIPMIFNLSMVDVLCCALGCVILLWLVNSREAKRRAQAAGETGTRLAAAKQELASTHATLDNVQSLLQQAQTDRDRAQQLVEATDKNLNATRKALTIAQANVGSLRKDLKNLQTANQALNVALDKKSKVLAGLDLRLAKADQKAGELEKQLQAKTDLLTEASAQAEGLQGELQKARKKVAKLETQVAGLRADDKTSQAKLAVADAQNLLQEKDLGRLKKELEDLNRLYQKVLGSRANLDRQLALRDKEMLESRLSIAGLEKEKHALEDRIRIARLAADNRFAGISLRGRKVVFLVDMSGSMDLLDEQTPAPDKWPLLCETLARIMRSLPDLTDYQVILFSDKVSYPLGNRRRWLTYDKETSAKNVKGALLKIKAQGGTNMAAAFAETFEFRAQGLDTVYVFSDGLPNMGDGLPQDASQLSESQKTAYCARYVRQMLKDVWNRAAPGQPRVRINAIGFFFESPDVGAFLWAMCRENQGSFVGMSDP